ncbi:hypothetical protein M0R45_015410 [Rubus argutus]|uniref:Methyltransferase n=1 Tax=Rubus argutus TaxID=59490 RepID=A0AAW1XSY5_RUBAR
MNFCKERHCPLPEETPLCLIPPPDGYKIPIQWPDSLVKMSFISIHAFGYFVCARLELCLNWIRWNFGTSILDWDLKLLYD